MKKEKRGLLFVRVSTKEQDYNRQIADLEKYCENHNIKIVGIISEKISGVVKNEKRKGIQKILEKAQQNTFDKLIITEISRLGRTPLECHKLIEKLNELNKSVVIQTLNIETLDENGRKSYLSSLLMGILIQLAMAEREILKERILSGISRAKQNGVHCGRPKGSTEDLDKIKKKYSDLIKDIRQGISIRKTAKIHSVSSSTVWRVKKLLKI